MIAKKMSVYHDKNPFVTVFIIYLLCLFFRVFEYFILRTDQSLLGEAFVHKLVGIAILCITVKMTPFTFQEIGFAKENIIRNVGKGLAFGLYVFTVAYGVEVAIGILQGNFESIQLYITAYAVDENVGHQTDLVFFVICIIGNIINVIMEEGVFRGLFQRMLEGKYSFVLSAIIASCLFGVWHIIAPIRNYYDGISSMAGCMINIAILVVTSVLIGFKFAMLTRMTGNLYMAMSDHFVNNTIINILHVVSRTGADELQFVRITIAQTLSFIIVLVYYLKKYRKVEDSR